MAGPLFAAIVAALLASQTAADAEPCQLNYSAGAPVTEAVRDRGFDFETFDRLCAAARQHGLELAIAGTSGVQSERAYGWASVTVRRAATGALSAREHLSTFMDTRATAPVAADMLYLAVNDAANEVAGRMDEHLRTIEAEEARLRAAYSAQAHERGRR